MDPNDFNSGGRSSTLSDNGQQSPGHGHSLVRKSFSEASVKRQAVKRHHHKHNLKHRYEFLETLGKGTYGKVKKAIERSGRMVRLLMLILIFKCVMSSLFKYFMIFQV